MTDRTYTFVLWSLLIVITGDVIVANPFMLLRIPPVGAGVPINQIALVFGVCAILFTSLSTAGFASGIVFLPLGLLWLMTSAHLIDGVSSEGIWAIRDAANVIESSMIFVGYCLASDRRFLPTFIPWFRALFYTASFYTLMYPLQTPLSRFSPSVSSMSGYEIPFLFFYGNPNSIGVSSACFLLTDQGKNRLMRVGLTALILMVLIVFVQARIVYLQLAALVLILCVFSPRKMYDLSYMGLVAFALMAVFVASGIEIPGRLGRTFSFDFLLNHLQAIWGGGNQTVSDAAEGVDLRLAWWSEIQDRLQRSYQTWFLGLGYGMPLTSFRGPDDDIVREPHNSFVSIYGRLGLVGIVLFVSVIMSILLTNVRLVTSSVARQFGEMKSLAICLLCFICVSLVYSTGEGGLEVSFIAVPVYFFSGIAIALQRQAETNPAQLAAVLAAMRPAKRDGSRGRLTQVGART